MFCLRKYVPEPTQRGYPDDVKQRALSMRVQGITVNEIASILNVHPRSIGNWIKSEPARAANGGAPFSAAPGSGDDVHIRANMASGLLAPRGRQRPTVSDVARLAKVSTSSVSNYINDTGRMGESTRDRIRMAMDELSFSPSALMRGLREGRTGIIGVGSGSLDYLNAANAIAILLLSGFNLRASKHEMNILIFTRWAAQEGNVHWTQFLDGHIDGLLWVDPSISEPSLARIAAAGLPVVGVLTRHVPEGVGYVNADNVGGIVSGVKHLFDLGHRRIAYAGQIDRSNYLDRWTGYREGLAEVGLPFDKSIEATGTSDFRSEGILPAAERWLRLTERPTAMIMPDDGCAFALIGFLKDRGLRVPEDVSVIGFDDTIDAETKGAVGLTTIRQEFHTIAEIAVEQLSRMIKGAQADQCRVVVPTSLVVRQTTGPAP
jgi:LacI family transcriptional regulator